MTMNPSEMSGKEKVKKLAKIGRAVWDKRWLVHPTLILALCILRRCARIFRDIWMKEQRIRRETAIQELASHVCQHYHGEGEIRERWHGDWRDALIAAMGYLNHGEGTLTAAYLSRVIENREWRTIEPEVQALYTRAVQAFQEAIREKCHD